MRWLLLGLLLPVCADAVQLQLVAATQDKATVIIDGGTPKTLRLKQSNADGIELIRADANGAEFQIGKKRQYILIGGIGQVGGGASRSTATPTSGALNLQADSRGHFWTSFSINGMPLHGLIDTGASSIALSSQHARQVGLEYIKGTRSYVSTASGNVLAFNVVLNEVRLGNMVLYQIPAMVLEGAFPKEPLIGNSLLNRLNMSRQGDQLTLSKRY